MFQCLLIGQLESYISTWGKMVGENWAKSEDGIETLKNLCWDANKRSKTEDILFQVYKKVKFELSRHFWGVNDGKKIEHIRNGNVNIGLEIDQPGKG